MNFCRFALICPYYEENRNFYTFFCVPSWKNEVLSSICQLSLYRRDTMTKSRTYRQQCDNAERIESCESLDDLSISEHPLAMFFHRQALHPNPYDDLDLAKKRAEQWKDVTVEFSKIPRLFLLCKMDCQNCQGSGKHLRDCEQKTENLWMVGKSGHMGVC